MEVLGGATAILTIAIEFHDVCKKLNRFIKNVKNAHNEVEIIAHEAETFALLLQRFGKTMRTADLPEGGFLVDLDSNNISDNIVQASKVIGDKIRHLLKKSEPLRLDKPEYSQFTRWFTLLKWSSWKEEWSQIHLFLVSTKVDAELLISMINFETLMNHIRALRTNHREVPEDLKQELEVSKRAIKALRTSVKKLQKKCQHLERRAEDRKAVQVNIVLAEATRDVVRSYINTHAEVKAILTTASPPTSPQVSNMESAGSVSHSEEGDPTRSQHSPAENSLTIEEGAPGRSETGIIDDDGESELNDVVWEGGDPVEEVGQHTDSREEFEVVVEEEARGMDEERDDEEHTGHGSRQSINEEVVEEGPSVRKEPGIAQVEEADPTASETESAFSFIGFTYLKDAPAKKPSEQWMQSAQYGFHNGKVRRRRQRPKTPDMPSQDIVVDRNDGRGARYEYRPPRRPRDRPTSRD